MEIMLHLQLSKLSTFVSSQKSSNFHLSQELETTQERINELQVEKENLSNQLERTAYAHAEEKIKLESQLSQQTKLIDFLQAKVEESKGKKKVGGTLFYGVCSFNY